MTADLWFWPALLGVLGLVLGSFVATLAMRWPEGRTLGGRSACDGCGKELGARELVPVLSFIVQRGRCGGCGAPIRLSHPLTESIAGAIGIAAGCAAPGLDGLAGSIFGWLLLTLAALDLAAFWLPNILTATLAAAGLLTGMLHVEPPLGERLIGGAAGFCVLWLVAEGYRRLRGRQGLGGGDPKMFGGVGLWLGWQALPMVLLAACLTGLAAVLVLQARGRRTLATDRLPFGVLLAAAGWTVWLASALQASPGSAAG